MMVVPSCTGNRRNRLKLDSFCRHKAEIEKKSRKTADSREKNSRASHNSFLVSSLISQKPPLPMGADAGAELLLPLGGAALQPEEGKRAITGASGGLSRN